MAFSLALYLALPFMQISWTPEVLSGVGILTSIFCPIREGLKLVFSTTLTSIFVRPTSRRSGIIRNGNEMSLVMRYRINSYSPSGGIKLMACSDSNLDSLTHWWNWQSSIAMEDFDPEGRAVSSRIADCVLDLLLLSMVILSFIPNLHSGIPERYDFIMTLPATWAESTCPEN